MGASPSFRKDFSPYNEEANSMYKIRFEWGHWTVYKDGQFYCTADTKAEAMAEIGQ